MLTLDDGKLVNGQKMNRGKQNCALRPHPRIILSNPQKRPRVGDKNRERYACEKQSAPSFNLLDARPFQSDSKSDSEGRNMPNVGIAATDGGGDDDDGDFAPQDWFIC